MNQNLTTKAHPVLPETMPAVVYKGKGTFTLEDRPVPTLQAPEDVIVRVTLASVCSSDLHIKHGSVPRAVPGTIVGHEMVGIVEQTGTAVTSFVPGDRVTVNVETYCGECFYCKRGFVNNCTSPLGGWALGCRIDGGQAAYVRVPLANQGLNHIPEEVSDEQAIFTGDILSTGYWAAKISEIQSGDTVAVLGAGPTGLCAMLCARLYHPARIIAIDPDEHRLALAARHQMADVVIHPQTQDADRLIRELTCGRGADVVLEAAGGTDTFQTAWKIARPNAAVCIVAMYETPQTLPLPDMYGKNLRFLTGGVDACDCGAILKLIAEGRLDTTPLITHRYALADAMEAYRLFEAREDHVLKVVLVP